jgi:AcrR family transcriptional regulator
MNNLLPVTELKLKRKPGRPRSKRSEEAIIRATTSLLADERYADLTVSKVAARARASKSTIYRRWPTKEHLVIEAFNRWPALLAHDRGDVMSDLLDLYRQFLRILHRPPSNAIMPTLVAERAHNPALAAVFDPLMQRRRDPVRVVLRRAMERGELPRSTDVELAVDAIMGVTVLRMYFIPGNLSIPAIREFLTVLLRGLGARGY